MKIAGQLVALSLLLMPDYAFAQLQMRNSSASVVASSLQRPSTAVIIVATTTTPNNQQQSTPRRQQERQEQQKQPRLIAQRQREEQQERQPARQQEPLVSSANIISTTANDPTATLFQPTATASSIALPLDNIGNNNNGPNIIKVLPDSLSLGSITSVYNVMTKVFIIANIFYIL